MTPEEEVSCKIRVRLLAPPPPFGIAASDSDDFG